LHYAVLHSRVSRSSHSGNCTNISNGYGEFTLFRLTWSQDLANSIPPVSGSAPGAQQIPQKIGGAAHAVVPTTGSAPDRVAPQGSPLPALLLGATAAAQLVPGVIEAEGASGAATALAIAVRSATASPAARAIVAAAAGAAGSYARSLVHDATAGQPALRPIVTFGHALDTSVHTSLGIPQSDPR
jgi:hypothetical protein